MRIRSVPHRATCAIPGCGRPTMAAAGTGLADCHCQYHVQRRARYGSHWAAPLKATDLKPYLKAAHRWIAEHRNDIAVTYPLIGLQGLMDGAGQVERAQDIKRLPAAKRARVAFARLREAGVKPERLLAIHMAVAALIEDDRDSHNVPEFRLVQTAKAVHRLASGTHSRWEVALPNGTTAPLAIHNYPRSSGQVLRVMGRELDEICRGVMQDALDTVRRLRVEMFGPHPSQRPDWLPRHTRVRLGLEK
ncbi:hypothetical protein [Bosea sp. LC85]|uniref:hypothetical protein n=1 Tax=Bosea sp. LC85 TaxID=1502851 RepID=UPI001FCB9D8A|nr:hypothetical protein [Bosea sp. LC85]